MNIKRIQEIASNIEILRSARFYLLNGFGTIGFKTKSINVVYPNSIRRKDGFANGTAALVLIKKLNNAIQPILEAEAAQLQAEIKQMAIEGK